MTRRISGAARCFLLTGSSPAAPAGAQATQQIEAKRIGQARSLPALAPARK